MEDKTQLRIGHSGIHSEMSCSNESLFSAHRQSAASWIIKPEVIKEDLPRLFEIERESFSAPWTVNMFRDAVSSTRGTLGCTARSVRDHVIGYGVCQVVVDEVNIHRVVVTRDYQRCGVGFGLLRSMLNQATVKGAQVASLEVRENNLAARKLYESTGFVRVARRSAYYRNPDGAALIYVLKNLNEDARPLLV